MSQAVLLLTLLHLQGSHSCGWHIYVAVINTYYLHYSCFCPRRVRRADDHHVGVLKAFSLCRWRVCSEVWTSVLKRRNSRGWRHWSSVILLPERLPTSWDSLRVFVCQSLFQITRIFSKCGYLSSSPVSLQQTILFLGCLPRCVKAHYIWYLNKIYNKATNKL